MLVVPVAAVRVNAAETFITDSSAAGLWLVCSRADVQGVAGLLFAYRPTDEAFTIPRVIRAQHGDIRLTAVAGERLHAFFVEQGQHMSYSARVGRSPQGRLPDWYVPMAVGPDAKSGDIYAIVPTWLARKIPVPTTRPTRTPTSRPADSPPAEPRPAPSTTTRADGHALVVYSARAWRNVGPIPQTVPIEREICFVGVAADAVHVISRPGGQGPIHHAVYQDGQWNVPGSFGEDWAGTVVRLFVVPVGDPRRLVLLGTVPVHETDRVRLELLAQAQDGNWAEPLAISDGDALVELPAGAFSAAVVGDRLALFRMGDEQRIFEAQADLAGKLVRGFESIPVFEPYDKPTLPPHVKGFLTPLVLMTVLLVLYWRREDGILEPAALPRGVRVAPAWARLVGLVVDLAPAVLLTGPMWYAVATTQRINWAEILRDPTTISISLYGTCWLTRILYAVYCGVFEAVLGKTPGKMLTGCWIVDEHGRRLGLRAAWVRNAFRLVETEPLFSIWWVVILVWLTRNHQRLGDILARTIVVQAYPVCDEGEPESGDDDDAGESG